MTERRFVLAPLAEACARSATSCLRRTVRELLAEVAGNPQKKRLAGAFDAEFRQGRCVTIFTQHNPVAIHSWTMKTCDSFVTVSPGAEYNPV